MALRIRTSKFRHVYGAQTRREHMFENVRITRNTHDSNFCSVNPRFLAVVTESSGGGSFAVLDVNRPGRVDIDCPKVCGHAGTVMDIKWNPFSDCIIASGSEDTTVKIWTVPQTGLLGTLTDWSADLHGHTRRLAYIDWHPTAANVLMSVGFDFKINVWNVEQAEPITQVSCHSDTIYSVCWALDGSLLASTCKDKNIRIIDPRAAQVAMKTQGHQSAKASKLVFVSDRQVFTTGFSRVSDRQYALWDIRQAGAPLNITDLDCSSGILLPYYDPDIHVVYLAGKGDGNIRYFEVVSEDEEIHFLNTYQSALPQRGFGMMPKRGIDPMRNEVARFYKLHASKNLVEPISMIVPRKAEGFQPDVFPPTSSQIPSLTADEWSSGVNRGPILVELESGTILDKPKSTISAAVQPQLGGLSKAPQITTFKAVSRQSPGPYQQPHMSNQQPPVSYQQPPGSYQEPQVSYQQAPASFQQSLAQFQQPSTTYHQVPSPYQQSFPQHQGSPSSYQSAPPASGQPVSGSRSPSTTAFSSAMSQFQQPPPIYGWHSPASSSLRSSPEGQQAPAVMRSPSHIVSGHQPGGGGSGWERSQQEPASIKNIKRLSMHGQEGEERQSPTSSARAPSPTSSVSSGHGRGQGRASRSPGSPHSVMSPPPPSPSSVSQVNGYTGDLPAGDHAIHVRKVWSPPPPATASPIPVSMSAGVHSPGTDPELKKAYFRQLEEIRSLQEQLQLKDRRIKQLEKELEMMKDQDNNLGPGESNC